MPTRVRAGIRSKRRPLGSGSSAAPAQVRSSGALIDIDRVPHRPERVRLLQRRGIRGRIQRRRSRPLHRRLLRRRDGVLDDPPLGRRRARDRRDAPGREQAHRHRQPSTSTSPRAPGPTSTSREMREVHSGSSRSADVVSCLPPPPPPRWEAHEVATPRPVRRRLHRPLHRGRLPAPGARAARRRGARELLGASPASTAPPSRRGVERLRRCRPGLGGVGSAGSRALSRRVPELDGGVKLLVAEV